MVLNHIGMACKDFEETTRLLELMGYKAGEVMHDYNQCVDVRFMYCQYAPTIELLFNKAIGIEKSPIDKIIEKNGTCIYHLCYEVDNIDEAIVKFRNWGYMLISNRKQSLIENKDVVFMYSSDNIMIELIETNR